MASQAKLAILITAKDQASKRIGGIKNALGGIAKVAGGTAGAIGLISAAAFKLASDATAVDTTRQTFDKLTTSIDTSSQTMLGQLRQATQGMVSDFELMQSSNKLMSMGLADSSESASNLTEMAVTLGQAMGTGADAVNERLCPDACQPVHPAPGHLRHFKRQGTSAHRGIAGTDRGPEPRTSLHAGCDGTGYGQHEEA